MPKFKTLRGSTPPTPPPIVIKEMPTAVAPPAKAQAAPVPAADPEPPHYY